MEESLKIRTGCNQEVLNGSSPYDVRYFLLNPPPNSEHRTSSAFPSYELEAISQELISRPLGKKSVDFPPFPFDDKLVMALPPGRVGESIEELEGLRPGR
jgi:hypothetical protein